MSIKIVELEEYNPEWKQYYELEKVKFQRAIGTKVLGLEHIGSTSVQGLIAKPIIDILLGIEDLNDLEILDQSLRKIGYIYRRLTGCKTLNERNSKIIRIVSGGPTANKSPIRSANNQWGMKENPH